LKQNKTTLIVIITGFIACGLLLIYRGLQSVDNLYKFNGTITNKTIQQFQSTKSGYSYSLDFSFAETDKIYGIYLGTKEQAKEDELINKIDIGKNYTFYIDQTFLPTVDNRIIGIRIIKNDEKTLYQENPKVNYIGGASFLFLGLLTTLLLLYADKRKKNAL